MRLFLTCKLVSEENPGSYRAESEASLVDRLGIRDEVVALGTVPYSLLHHVYHACQLYVTPAYAESFAHPLVEAMASGLPVIASDLPVHREICQDAGIYFSRFSPEELADRVMEIVGTPSVASRLRARRLERWQDFSWSRHADELVNLATQLASV